MDALNRASVVIRLPQDIQLAVVEAQNQIRRKAGSDLVRWTPQSELVFTLVALGEISPSQIAQLCTVLPAIAMRSPMIDLTLEGLGGSPNNLQPRFLWIGVGGDIPLLERLDADVERAVGPIVPGHEARGLQAHLPIGRLKQESETNRSSLGRAVRVAGIGLVGAFRAPSIELVRAAATSMGPTLVTVQSFAFAG